MKEFHLEILLKIVFIHNMAALQSLLVPDYTIKVQKKNLINTYLVKKYS